MSFRETVAKGPRVESVTTDAGTFHVKVLSGAERSALETEWEPYKGDEFFALVVGRTACDAQGKREFDDVPAAAVITEVLSAEGPTIIALANKAWKLNLFGKGGVDSEKNG